MLDWLRNNGGFFIYEMPYLGTRNLFSFVFDKSRLLHCIITATGSNFISVSVNFRLYLTCFSMSQTYLIYMESFWPDFFCFFSRWKWNTKIPWTEKSRCKPESSTYEPCIKWETLFSVNRQNIQDTKWIYCDIGMLHRKPW